MIWCTQWLCPQRHASIVFIWDPLEENQVDVVKRGEAIYARGTVARVCGICRSDKLRPVHQRTRFATMEEAEPMFKMYQERNELTRLLIGDPTPIATSEIPYPTRDDI